MQKYSLFPTSPKICGECLNNGVLNVELMVKVFTKKRFLPAKSLFCPW